ncbi:MAG TPA: class I SAM-dependent RNA methyltransferase, partial [Syntrophomonadaceae bacterium]|nr:class I SAM-dependent RNA methyltransferase [Syntrophomonadaceae bacterium]
FPADEAAIARCNLWLRSADRLLLKMGDFEARSFEELFERTKALPWGDWIPEEGEFPVEGKSVNSKLFSVSDCQAIVKKAIVEKMKQKYPCKWFSETGPRYRIEVALLKDIATLTIDTSGPGLHKRGYRQIAAPAPLKETLAAAMINISRWKPDRALIDPFCGSGTIPIEAALIGRNIAPGIRRDFIAEKWPVIPSRIWVRAREEARDLIDNNQPLGILGFDINNDAVNLARYNANQSGLKDVISFQCQPVAKLRSKYNYGDIICNPPSGERLAEKNEVEALYRQMGDIFKQLDTWSYYVLSSHNRFEQLFNRQASKRRKLYNGRIQCNLYQFFGPKPASLKGPFSKPAIE